MNKIKFSDKYINKLKKISQKAIKKKKYNISMSGISVAARYLYGFNQKYVDEDLELYIEMLAKEIKIDYEKNISDYKGNQNRILLYDGFGLDSRGTVLQYLNALGLNGYSVVYVTKDSSKYALKNVSKMCQKYNFTMEYINSENYYLGVIELIKIFIQYSPKSAFFYSLPNDVSGTIAFKVFEGKVSRYLIDLTDHAFWIGKNSVDYFLGSRNMSAAISYYFRNIPKEKLLKLDINPLVNEYSEHKDLPFNPLRERYIFSGGSLYKTLGDENNTYYKIIDYILANHNVLFLYAGNGDSEELEKIIKKYPSKAFLIDERKDFYYLIQNCVFYLNTYPMFGGMMMRYAALSNKLPLTLRHGNDADGLLINQEQCRIEYDSYDEMIKDIDLLLNDEQYLHEREKLLIGSVITEERLKKNIKTIIEKNQTDEEHEFIYMDTSQFLKEYYNRFNCFLHKLLIAERKNYSLFVYFPITFIIGFFIKIFKKIKSKIWRKK